MGKKQTCANCRFFCNKSKKGCQHRTYYGPKRAEKDIACGKFKPPRQ